MTQTVALCDHPQSVAGLIADPPTGLFHLARFQRLSRFPQIQDPSISRRHRARKCRRVMATPWYSSRSRRPLGELQILCAGFEPSRFSSLLRAGRHDLRDLRGEVSSRSLSRWTHRPGIGRQQPWQAGPPVAGPTFPRGGRPWDSTPPMPSTQGRVTRSPQPAVGPNLWPLSTLPISRGAASYQLRRCGPPLLVLNAGIPLQENLGAVAYPSGQRGHIHA